MPIIGPTTLAQEQENMACADWSLTPEQLKRLDDMSAIELGFPYSWAKDSFHDRLLFGEIGDRIDRPRVGRA